VAETLMVRVNKATHELLLKISATTGESMQAVIAKAVVELQRKQFFEQMNAAYSSLANDPEAYKAHCADLHLFDAAANGDLDEHKS
jgi:hypothetical protein